METKIQVLKSERRIYGFFWAISLFGTFIFSLFTFMGRGKCVGLTVDNQNLYDILARNVAGYFFIIFAFMFVLTSLFWLYVHAVIHEERTIKLTH